MSGSSSSRQPDHDRSDSASRAGSLLKAGASGALWQGLAQILAKTAVLVTTIVLARLLVPEEFGLVALALVLITYAETVADAGMAQALIYLPRRASVVRAATLCAAAAGTGLMVLALLSAPLIAALFRRPDVEPLVRLLSTSLLAASLGAIPEALLRRDLLFRRLTIATVVRAVITGAVSIAVAFAGGGAWAIAWGAVAGAVSNVVVAWLVLPVRPDLLLWRTTRSDVGSVLRFGIPVAAGALLAKAVFDADYLVVGRLLGAEALGYYTLAFRLPELVILNAFFVLSSVTFPLYSRARSDPEKLRRGYLLSFQVQTLFGVSAGVGLAIVAPLVVPLVFGSAWLPAVGPLVGLSIYAALRSLGAGANDVYKAIGRPGISVRVSLVRLVILVPALVLACRWGVTGVAWAQAIVAALFAVGMQAVALRVLKLQPRRLLASCAPAFVAGVMVAAATSLMASLPLPPAVTLVMQVVTGVLAATAAVAITRPALLKELVALVRSRTTAAS